MKRKFSFTELRKSALGGFRKSLVFGVSLMALLYSSMAYSANECHGWSGPTNCSGDSGHVAISDLCTQEKHSLNFVVHYVENAFDTGWFDTLGHADFAKCFNGINLPSRLQFQARCVDKQISNTAAGIVLVIVYQDTVWESLTLFGLPGFYWSISHENWMLKRVPESGYNWNSLGNIVQPETLVGHIPPGKIDTLKFRFIFYNHQEGNGIPAVSGCIDDLRFIYIEGSDTTDTLIDGMGDEMGIEETISVQKQTLEVYPNPCLNSTISIRYCLPTSGPILLEVYDITGSQIAFLEKKKPAGKYKKLWKARDKNGKRLSSGAYFLRMTTENGSSTRKLIILN